MGQATSTQMQGSGMPNVTVTRAPNVTVTQATPQQLQALQSKFAHLQRGGAKKTCKNMKKKSHTAKRKDGKHRK